MEGSITRRGRSNVLFGRISLPGERRFICRFGVQAL